MIQWYWILAWFATLFVQEYLHRKVVAGWHKERQMLLDRIQAPSLAVYKALETTPVPVKVLKPEAERVDQI